MFKKKLMKMLAFVLVMNVLIIPLTSFAPQEQNKYKVMAAEGIVDIKFYNAIISMIGITAAGLATMSPSFSIPEADLVEMKNNFAQTLEADAVKKQAWLAAQTDYLAGGVAKTMGALELAKIGLSDILLQFETYLKNNSFISSKNINNVNSSTITLTNGRVYELKIIRPVPFAFVKLEKTLSLNNVYYNSWGSAQKDTNTIFNIFKDSTMGGFIELKPTNYQMYEGLDKVTFTLNNNSGYYVGGVVGQDYINYPVESKFVADYVKGLGFQIFGIPESINGYLTNDNIIQKDEEYIHVYPTIPWIDNTVPIGTIVTPDIAAPYAGAVPIDIPITVPIDPPIDEPVDPPVEPTLIGTVAAILAGITPISGILDNIFAGQLDIADVITAGLTDVIDGIGDIAGTLTSGISSTLTDISTTITDFVNPSPETVSQLDLNPIKNIPGVLFTRFPFSIPFDFYNIIAFMGGSAREAPVFEFKIDLSSLALPDIEKQIDMQPFDQIAGYVRIAELLAFAIAVMLKTKTLIWG